MNSTLQYYTESSSALLKDAYERASKDMIVKVVHYEL